MSVVRYIQFSARGHRKANQRVVATFRSAPGIGPGDKFGFDGVERPRTMALSIPALQVHASRVARPLCPEQNTTSENNST